MKAFVVLALVGVTCAAPNFLLPYSGAVVGAAAPLPPVSYASQFHAQDELGQVNYGFAIPGQAKNEIRDAFGNVAGVYTYIDADNKPVHVEYTAGVNGVQFKSNNLPVGPDGSNLVAPEPVQDTPEVVAARAAFMEAYNAAVAAATTDPAAEDPVETADAAAPAAPAPAVPAPAAPAPEAPAPEAPAPEAPAPEAPAPEAPAPEAPATEAPAPLVAAPVAPVGPPEPVQDTPEVAKAKVEFQAAYDAAAAAAEAAPDYDLDGSISTYSGQLSGQLSAIDGALYTNAIQFGAPVQVIPSLV